MVASQPLNTLCVPSPAQHFHKARPGLLRQFLLKAKSDFYPLASKLLLFPQGRIQKLIHYLFSPYCLLFSIS